MSIRTIPRGWAPSVAVALECCMSRTGHTQVLCCVCVILLEARGHVSSTEHESSRSSQRMRCINCVTFPAPDSAKPAKTQPSPACAQWQNTKRIQPIREHYASLRALIGQPLVAFIRKASGPARLLCVYVSKLLANRSILCDWPGFEAASRLRQLIPLPLISSLDCPA